MAWTKGGTVAITSSQTVVTGTGTNFTNGRVGDEFKGPDGLGYEVTNILSPTSIAISPAYKGATVSGGAYAIVPVQGYPKALADEVNALVQQWGGTLAGLGSVSTENVVPVAKGGTGGTNPALARSGLGLKSAAVADIVGAVSQSGGVPTGAIVERGSNANGEYTKYADGTMICWRRDASITAVSITGNSGGQFFGSHSVSFPAFFASVPFVAHSSIPAGALTVPAYARGVSISSAVLTFGSALSVQSDQYISYIAVGRWF